MPRPAVPRIIEGEADIRDGVRALRRTCAIMRAVHDVTGDPPLRRRPAGFEGLARIVVGQQLSVASANAIWDRTFVACTPFEPQIMLALDDAQLFGVGLSRSKVRTLRAVSVACANGLDLTGLDGASEEEIHAALTEVVGIGPWTADVFIMFCLGRADGFAAGDLALQVAAQRALGLESVPTLTSSSKSPSAGGPGAGSRPGCSGPTTPPSRPSATQSRSDRGALLASAPSLLHSLQRLPNQDQPRRTPMQLKVSPISRQECSPRNGRPASTWPPRIAVAVMHGFHEGIFNHLTLDGAGQARPLLPDPLRHALVGGEGLAPSWRSASTTAR